MQGEGDTLPAKKRITPGSSTPPKRAANVQFYEADNIQSRHDFMSFDILQVRALRNIKRGEELFVDYGP